MTAPRGGRPAAGSDRPDRVGTVLGTVGGVYSIELPGGEIAEAVLRGRLKRNERSHDRVVAGDQVRLEASPDGSLVVADVLPRRTRLERRAPGPGRPRPRTIVANVDRVVIVFAAALPEPNSRTLDRFLVLTEAAVLEPVIVLNKIDLVGDDVAAGFLAPYRAAGYRTLLTSVPAGLGLSELREILCRGRSVLAGPSGAGKSSLLNAIEPGLRLRTATVSEAVLKGKHTTVGSRLIRLVCGGYVADTPGLREVGMWGVERAALDRCFPELRAVRERCRFDDCSHTHEPDCAVREAVAEGGIPAARYESYVALREEE